MEKVIYIVKQNGIFLNGGAKIVSRDPGYILKRELSQEPLLCVCLLQCVCLCFLSTEYEAVVYKPVSFLHAFTQSTFYHASDRMRSLHLGDMPRGLKS